MLLTRKEMTYDFGGARLDPVADREALGWMMNQFLYGEVTGIQVGRWLYDAPDLESARFLARQAVEELQHIDNFLVILGLIDVAPAAPHPVLRFLATGMMGSSWAEHVSLEMAAGEGYVLMCFYAIIDTLDQPQAVDILKRAVRQEERHVEFGERQTMKAIEGHPGRRRRLLGLNLVSLWGIRRLARFIEQRLPKGSPVLRQLPQFLAKVVHVHELRMQRMGLLDRPLAALPTWRRVALVLEAYAGKLVGALVPKRNRRLTDTYLADPALRPLALPSRHDEGPPALL